jgi:F0F1-type ATP synthase membrane subunit b/b'
MDILVQLKGLFLQAAPTMVLVIVFYIFLRSQFFAPLEKAMAERSARIEGARKSGEANLAEAAELERTYQGALRKARTEIYAELDVARRAVLDERSNLIRAARERGNAAIRSSKDAIAQEAAAARARLEAASQELASEIVRLILSGSASGPGGGPRVPGGRV